MHVDHIALRVTDLDAERAFYEETLGLEYDDEFEIGGVRNVMVSGEDGMGYQFQYDPDDESPVEPSGIDHVAVVVDDLDAALDAVEADGHPLLRGPIESDDLSLRVAFVEDPEGYAVELVERR